LLFDRSWTMEIHGMRRLTELWSLVCARTEERRQKLQALALHTRIFWWQGEVFGGRKRERIASAEEAKAMGWKEGELVRPARHHLRNRINEHLAEDIPPHVEWRRDNKTLLFSRVPQTLIGALWLQFARRLSERLPTSYVSCRRCGEQLTLAHSRETGNRADAKFCSGRCRQASYRSRQVKARTLQAEGKSLQDITEAIGGRPATVRRWIAPRM
jgi:hypothetical protein